MTVIQSNGIFRLPSTAVPISLTPVANYDCALDCTLDSLWVCNTTASLISLTVSDGEGNPIIPGLAIVQGTRVAIITDECPVFAKSGFSISAAADGLYFGGEWRV